MFQTHERLPHNLSWQSQHSACNQQQHPHMLDPQRQLQPVGQPSHWHGYSHTGRQAAHHPNSQRCPKPRQQDIYVELCTSTSSNTLAGGLPFAMTACTSGGLLPKLFFHCAPGCCGYPWTHTTPVQTPSNPTAIQCTTAVSVAQMLRRQRTAEFFWFLSCFCDSSAPPLSFPPIHKLLLQVLLPSSKYSLPLCPSARPFQLNVSVGCFLLPQSPPSQLIIRLYFTSLLIPLYFWILPHPTTKPPCSISSVQRLPRTPPQQVDYGFSHQYLISSLSWLLHNIFCWYLSTASFSSPCACVMMCFKRKTLSSRLHSMPLPRLSTATSSHAANLEVRPSLLASQPSTAAQRTVGLRWD